MLQRTWQTMTGVLFQNIELFNVRCRILPKKRWPMAKGGKKSHMLDLKESGHNASYGESIEYFLDEKAAQNVPDTLIVSSMILEIHWQYKLFLDFYSGSRSPSRFPDFKSTSPHPEQLDKTAIGANWRSLAKNIFRRTMAWKLFSRYHRWINYQTLLR